MNAPPASWRQPRKSNAGVGFSDRDYNRDEYDRSNGFQLRLPQSATTALILINVVLWATDSLLFPDDSPRAHRLMDFLQLDWETWRHPLSHPFQWWQFFTCGFAHGSFMHLFSNMLELFFLGKFVEQAYGTKEFTRFYLSALVVGSIGWAVLLHIGLALGFVADDQRVLLGASGAISGVVMLFVLNFPQAKLMLLFPPIPIKAWVIGVFLIGMNVFGVFEGRDPNQQGPQVAYSVHLFGIAFAAIYFLRGWNLGAFFSWFRMPRLPQRPAFRIHNPDKDDEPTDLRAEVDRILEKIHLSGESSLTKKERRTLEEASREFQRRNRGGN